MLVRCEYVNRTVVSHSKALLQRLKCAFLFWTFGSEKSINSITYPHPLWEPAESLACHSIWELFIKFSFLISPQRTVLALRIWMGSKLVCIVHGSRTLQLVEVWNVEYSKKSAVELSTVKCCLHMHSRQVEVGFTLSQHDHNSIMDHSHFSHRENKYKSFLKNSIT